MTTMRRRTLLRMMLASPLLVACQTPPAPVAVATGTPAPTPSPTSRPAAFACVAPAGDSMVLRVVDKQRALPDGYAPTDLVRLEDRLCVPGFAGARLRRDAADALVTLLSASRTAGYDLRIKSGFRSYAEQVDTFQFWVNQHGLEMAKRESAPPGHSEHQMGTTADLTCASVDWQLEEIFGSTPEAKWLAAHVHEFGFGLSYPQNSEDITGYVWEPWHVRYLGKECAGAWQKSGMVLVKFLEAVAKA